MKRTLYVRTWIVLVGLLVLNALPAIGAADEGGLPLDWNFDVTSVPWSEQYWSAAVADDGLVYWINTDGVVEYDGNEPTLLPGSLNRWFVRAQKDLDGNIWLAGLNQLAILKPVATGGRDVVSLLDRVPAEARNFGSVRRIFATEKHLFFMSSEYLIRLDRGDTSETGPDYQFWKTDVTDEFRGGGEINGEFFMVKDGSGLFRVQGDELIPVKHGESLSRQLIVHLIPADEKVIACTAKKGVLLFEDGELKPLSEELQAITVDAILSDCGVIGDDRFMLSSFQAGVVIFNAKGEVLEHYAVGKGLPINWLDDLPVYDQTGGLWFAHAAGVTRLDVGMPIRRFSPDSGLRGTVVITKRIDGQIYVGTTDSLFRLQAPDRADDSPDFVPAPNGEAGVFGLATFNDKFMVSGQGGVRVLDPLSSEWSIIYDDSSADVLVGPNQKSLFGGRWLTGLLEFREFDDGIRLVAEHLPDANGTGFLTIDGESLWVKTGPNSGPNKIARMSFDDVGQPMEPKVFGEMDGLPEGFELELHYYGGRVVAAQKTAKLTGAMTLFIFDPKTERFTATPSFAASIRPELVSPSQLPLTPAQDRAYMKQLELFPDKPIESYFSLGKSAAGWSWYEEGNVAWISEGVGNLIRVDFAAPNALRAAPKTNIRRVQMGEAQLRITDKDNVDIDFSKESLRIDVWSTASKGHSKLVFRTRMIGLSSEWSKWEANHTKEYPALREGKYVFEAQSRDGWNRLSNVVRFPFVIHPPWWRTTWAYLVAALIIGGLVFLYARRRILVSQKKVIELQAEIDRRELAEYNYQTAFENVPTALVLVRIADGVILDCNAAFELFLGWSKTDIIGSTGQLLNVWTDPEQLASVLLQLKNTEVVHDLEVDVRVKDGSIRECRYSSSLIHHESEPVFLVAFRDRTSIRNSRRAHKQLQDQLHHLQTLEDVGTLSSGIAHDFKNIMSVITLHAKLATTNRLEPDKVLEYMGQIEKAGVYATDLVDQMMTFSRPSDANVNEIDIRLVLVEVVRFFDKTLPPAFNVTFTSQVDAANAIASATQIQQILLNLGTNSVHAMGEGGSLDFVLSTETLDATKQLSTNLIEPGEYHIIRVSDTGQGIDPAIRDRIFEPFFTTKSARSGTGLGLSMVSDIMRSQNGGIELHSSTGRGTTMDLYWPTATTESDEKNSEVSFLRRGNAENILLIDDNQSIAKLYALVLQGAGYGIVSSITGAEALQQIAGYPGRFDLIVCDFDTVNRNELDHATENSSMSPKLPIVALYSSTPDDEIGHPRSSAVSHWLTKPVTPAELCDAVASIFEENS